MEDFQTYLSNNIFNFTSVFLSFTSLLLAYYFYIKTRKVKLPYYAISSFPTLYFNQTYLKKLEVKYLESNIEKLTATQVAFWNAGRSTINKEDIPFSSPLKIISKEGTTIYNAEIVSSLEDSNNFQLEQIDDTIIINFDYIDYNQGILVHILHSGSGSDDIAISGKVKGVERLNELDTAYADIKDYTTKTTLTVVFFCIIFANLHIEDLLVRISAMNIDEEFTTIINSLVIIPFYFLGYLTMRLSFFIIKRQMKMPNELKKRFEFF